MPPAARITDTHGCPGHGVNPITTGSPNVFIGGLPAAHVADICACADPIVKGSIGVFINGLPAARIGDQTAHGGIVMTGCPTVIIGEMGGGGAGGIGSSIAATMSLARQLGLPFTKASCGA